MRHYASIVVPVFLAPVIDQHNPKRIVVVFGLAISSVDAAYDLAYQCLYPELIPSGYKQKGYAVSAMLDPLATALIAPIVAVAYTLLGIEIIFLAEGILLITAAIFEMQINYQKIVGSKSKFNFFRYLSEYRCGLISGIRYLKEEKGIRNIYFYMAVSNAASNGKNLMTMAFFQNSNVLTAAMYPLMISAETFGRFAGGAFHYFTKMPQERRYAISVSIYTFMEICDGFLLFMTYPLMLVLRFVHGFLGVNSGTIKEAAVQNYLPSDMRARVNGLFNAILAAGMFIVQILVGALGEVFSFLHIVVGLSFLTIICMFFLIVRDRSIVKRIYNQNL